MATVIVRYCDQHMAAGDDVPADAWSLTITPPGDRVKAFDIDLCPDCAKGLVDLIAHFEDVARKGAAPAKASGKAPGVGRAGVTLDDPEAIECPDCQKVSKNRSSLGSHARRAHDKSLSELLGEELLYQCMNCPEPYPQFGSGTGFSAHRRATHNIPAGAPLLPGEDLKESASVTPGKKRTRKRLAPKDAETLL